MIAVVIFGLSRMIEVLAQRLIIIRIEFTKSRGI